MPITNHFYNSTTKKYIAVFGSLFNKLLITREDNEGTKIQEIPVPISYGPYQKFLARLDQDPNLDQKAAISLPRISFELQSMSYDGSRKVLSINKMKALNSMVYTPAPYNLEFSLNIMTKYSEDGTKILEQIIPFFKPEYTISAKLMPGIPAYDIPIILNGISLEDMYESDFETRRVLIWTLNFTMKGYYFGPMRSSKLIKFIDVELYGNIEKDQHDSRITVQPGLTEEGTPTANTELSIPYEEIQLDDDWGVITIIESNLNEESN
jgi:hypothetical protein